MKISLNWIKDFVDVPADVSAEEIGRLITMKTAEVEEVIDQAKSFENIVVGEIMSIEKHPDADRLQVCKVSDGSGEHQIVCGSPDIYEGMKCALALPGAMVRWHGEGDLVKIKKAKVRGIESNGMICAGSEIGVEMEGEMDMVDLKGYDCKAGDGLAEAMGMNDVVLDIDNKSLTHRPDLWNHYGFAREIASIFGKELKEYTVDCELPGSGEKVEIEVQGEGICRHSSFAIMTGIKIQSSPQWMQTRLRAVGINPINNVVDVTNYVMLECSPMHAYDRKIVATDKLVVRKAGSGEKLETIDHKKRDLSTDDVVITNGEEVLLVAGVMGGAKSEINDNTTEIILEAANWDPVLVRQTSTRLGLRTDSSARFEKSLDSANCPLAVKRAIELISEMCPEAKAAGPLVDESFEDVRELKVDFSVEETSRKIGVDIEGSEMKRILESLGFEVEGDGDVFKVGIPSWRATKDVDIKDDLVEEVARMYGYDQIPALLPNLPVKLPEQNHERSLKHEARLVMSAGLGFYETRGYSFYSKEDLDSCLLSEDNHLQIENFLSTDQTHMRVSLVPNLLKSVVLNLKNSEELKLYEIGRTYVEKGEYFPLEEKWIAAAVVRPSNDGLSVFYDVKGNLLAFIEKLGVKGCDVVKSEQPCSYAHPNRCADVVCGKTVLGSIFELHPVVAKKFGLDSKEVGLFEVNFSELVKLVGKDLKYSPIPKFPALEIDISVVVDADMPVGDVRKAIAKTARKHNLDLEISGVELFDLYEGEGIPEGKKALAFKIEMVSDERTLTSEEMKVAQEKIFSELKNVGGEIRGA